jgi:hypothetical protein
MTALLAGGLGSGMEAGEGFVRGKQKSRTGHLCGFSAQVTRKGRLKCMD